MTLPRAHSVHGPGLPFANPFIIHKLIVFILGLGCKIVVLSCEDAICFLLALESVIWHPHMEFSEKRAECSVPECLVQRCVSAGRYLLCLQESRLPLVSGAWGFLFCSTIWLSNISAAFLFHNCLSRDRKGTFFFVDYVLDFQGEMSALMWGQFYQEDQRQSVRHVEK